MDGNSGYNDNGGYDANGSYTGNGYYGGNAGYGDNGGYTGNGYYGGNGGYEDNGGYDGTYGYAYPNYGGYPGYGTDPVSDYYAYTNQKPTTGKNVCAKISQIFGIIALCILCTGSGIPLAVAAVILGSIGKDADRNAEKAIKGRNLGIIGIVLNGILFIVCLILRVVLENY